MISSASNAAGPSSLVARLVSAPILSAPEHARARLADWIVELGPVQRAAIADMFRRVPNARTIFESIAEASPYLFDLIRADAARVLRLLQNDPDTHMANLISGAVRAVAGMSTEDGVMQALRRLKSEAALLIALCDIGGVWSLPRVTNALTDVAVAAVNSTVRFLLTMEAARGRLLPSDPDRADEGSGLIVLAMGKMGAGELNYSSDIDLIVFFDPDASTLLPDIEPQPFFVRITQALVRIMQQRTIDGYVLRTDLRLRPDPASTPVAVSTTSALHYYEREGRTWERAAMVKARPCAGDMQAGAALLAELAPFVWRKHLDFPALADVHDMKHRMQAFKGHADVAVAGHNVKIGRGGIREIEFFAQTQQLVAGGRNSELRVRATQAALDILADTRWITIAARDELTAAYEFLRRVEHRLQMVADEQTHTLPEEPEAIERFARFLGYRGGEAFKRDLLVQLNCVQFHYSKLFEGDPAGTAKLPAVDYGAGAEDARLLAHLAASGFKQPKMVAYSASIWLSGAYRALKRDRTRRALQAFLPALITELARAENPDAAVIAFDRFLHALGRGERLIALLSQHRDLVGLVALVLGAAPRLGDMLARQPRIIDGLIDPTFLGTLPGSKLIPDRLVTTLGDSGSYEEFLDRLRMFGQESLFLIGARILSGTVSARQAGVAFADVAEGIVRTVHDFTSAQFARQYGTIKRQQTAILAMGKLGSREMTASSDLDLILIYDFDEGSPDSDGERSLHGAQYFARFTQRLIGAFTTRTNYGVLYDIDMRLRPSGRAGPLASHIDAFAAYQNREAWTWEHMALTRARVVSSSPDLQERIERTIRDVLRRRRSRDVIATDVLEMRRAIGEEKGEQDIWDLKYAAGGLIDIEFIAQYLQLVHAAKYPDILSVNTLNVLNNAFHMGLLPSAAADVLRSATRLYQDLNQVLRLCLSVKFVPSSAGEDLLRMMTRAGDAPNFSVLEAQVRDTRIEVRNIFLETIKVENRR